MKRLFALWVILFIVFTIWVGVDRHRLQKRINALEYQQDGLILAKDMAQYRAKHPFREVK